MNNFIYINRKKAVILKRLPQRTFFCTQTIQHTHKKDVPDKRQAGLLTRSVKISYAACLLSFPMTDFRQRRQKRSGTYSDRHRPGFSPGSLFTSYASRGHMRHFAQLFNFTNQSIAQPPGFVKRYLPVSTIFGICAYRLVVILTVLCSAPPILTVL